MQLMFIYGSLKRGFNRHNILRDQRYIGVARTTANYAMFGYGGFPALVDQDLAEVSGVTATNNIFGELYEVDDACMMELDKIEGVDRGLFDRKEISLDSITMVGLPMSEDVWRRVASKRAVAYFFKLKLNGAGDVGVLWTQK